MPGHSTHVHTWTTVTIRHILLRHALRQLRGMHASSTPGHILVVILPESRLSAFIELVRLGLIGRRNPERIALPTPPDGRPQICGERGRAPRGCVAPGGVCPLSGPAPFSPTGGQPLRSAAPVGRLPDLTASLQFTGSSARTWHRVHGQARLREKLARLHPNMCTCVHLAQARPTPFPKRVPLLWRPGCGEPVRNTMKPDRVSQASTGSALPARGATPPWTRNARCAVHARIPLLRSRHPPPHRPTAGGSLRTRITTCWKKSSEGLCTG